MPRISPARKDARRADILASASRCFARLGFQKTTIQDICAESGLSVGAIYSYFDGKEAIIAALSETGRRVTADLIGANEGDAAPIDRLRTVLRQFDRSPSTTIYQLDVRGWAEAIGDPAQKERTLAAYFELVGQLADLTGPLANAAGLEPKALAELLVTVITGCEVRKAISPDADVGPLLGAFLCLLQPDPATQP